MWNLFFGDRLCCKQVTFPQTWGSCAERRNERRRGLSKGRFLRKCWPMRRFLVQGFWIFCGVMFYLSGVCVYGKMGTEREGRMYKTEKMYPAKSKARGGAQQSGKKIKKKKKPVKKNQASKAGTWKRPLLDKQMVAGKQFGMGNFNRALDDNLRIVNDRHRTLASRHGADSRLTLSQRSSKGPRLLSGGRHGRSEKQRVQHSQWGNQQLGRITVYWAKGKGTDRYTRRLQSATGVRLMRGHCAVDPAIIPYGSIVRVHGVGDFWAVDTGSAVKARKAATRLGRNREEREAIVVDLFFPNRQEALKMARQIPRFTMVSWKVLPRH